ncbi:MAG TPA: hypothetical protein VJP58_07365 [Candidatus Nitrosocosmicus sp.]|nr:hypothetical protein [Candidatus Nitrosocosmicus sp.]
MIESVVPLLLAGPIIRRVDKTQVCIWIATSKAVSTKVEIFSFYESKNNFVLSKEVSEQANKELVPRLSASNMHIIGSGKSTSLKLGDHLYVSLIVARPFPLNENNEDDKTNMLPTFPTEEILAYDVELYLTDESKEKGLRLKDLGLLSGENTILYDNSDSRELDDHDKHRDKPLPPLFSLPTFYISTGKNSSELNILYGSCRKLHGEDGDSLTIGDKLIASSVSDPKKRPSSLFLIGDQIYADDVPGPLIEYLGRLSKELLGWQETVDGIDKTLEDISIGDRKDIVRSNAQLTSEVSYNHLLGFGEFAAMYLISWNPLIWPKEFDSYLSNLSHINESKQKYEKELKELEVSRKNLKEIRRLLANIPTYMICDDHEITDDWNIDRKWYDSVRNSRSGSQIVTNGLVAYWAFQAWGNDPNSFDDDFIAMITKYLDLKKQKSLYQFSKTSKVSNLLQGSRDNEIYDTQIIESRIWIYKKWTFVAPTYPLSVFLDCRTQREFVNPDGPPQLLNDEVLDYIESEVYKMGYEQGDPLVIISPTPVFGFEHAESVQRFLTSISGTYKWDLETWRANETGFIKFLTFVSTTFSPDYCVILSGDVHYAFTMKARFDLFNTKDDPGIAFDLKNDAAIQSSLLLAQLTASPLRSNKFTNRKLAIMILNLVHKVLITRKIISRTGFFDTSYGPRYYKNLNPLKDLKEDYKFNRVNPNYSKHGKGVSFPIKLKTIIASLIDRYFVTKNVKTGKKFPNWRESRMLVTPKGHGTTPVLANNNMGSVSLDLTSHTLKHTLYFLESNKIRNSVAKIEFDGIIKDIR